MSFSSPSGAREVSDSEAACILGRIPRQEQSALNRDRIWRCSFEMSMSALLFSFKVEADEGLTQGNWLISSRRWCICCIARLLKSNESQHWLAIGQKGTDVQVSSVSVSLSN